MYIGDIILPTTPTWYISSVPTGSSVYDDGCGTAWTSTYELMYW